MNNIKKFREKAVVFFLSVWTVTFLLQAVFKLLPLEEILSIAFSAFMGALGFIIYMYLHAKRQDKKNS